MDEKIERLLSRVCSRLDKEFSPNEQGAHLSEEDIVCFLEDKIGPEEKLRQEQHLIACDICLEALIINLNLAVQENPGIAPGLLKWAQDLAKSQNHPFALEIFLRVKDNLLELLNTTGDVLVGQELILSPVLRSRNPMDFKDEVLILKDFPDVRVEVRVENKVSGYFSLSVLAKDKNTLESVKDLRITLIQEDKELESYVADLGKVVFESLRLGVYTVELSRLERKIATVILEIKK